MEDLFREILAPSPVITSATLPTLDVSKSQSISTEMTTTSPSAVKAEDAVSGEVVEVGNGAVDAQENLGLSEVELQRILDMLPAVPMADATNSFFDLEVDLTMGVVGGVEAQTVGVL
jgi:hypothetical protein